ncbi:MAG TPA: hypothetical protein VEG27_03230 [Usitatibacter sp.]|nr:hypothetical protein [Usitatibacter sp.]
MKAARALALAAALLVGAFLAMELAGGPFASASGVVGAVEPAPAGADTRATVLLASGARVEARLPGRIRARPGQAVEVRVASRLLLPGPASYEILEVKDDAATK